MDSQKLSRIGASPIQTYRAQECAVFCKVKETWGIYSNMWSSLPLRVNGTPIKTSEALYQACRYPDQPAVQNDIIKSPSPMTAKWISRGHKGGQRRDFDALRVEIMWWVLRVKLACNFKDFSRVLLASKDSPIVELSRKDDFWGAKAVDKEGTILEGRNVLGQLLVALREEVKEGGDLRRVAPPAIDNLRLLSEPIGEVIGGRF